MNAAIRQCPKCGSANVNPHENYCRYCRAPLGRRHDNWDAAFVNAVRTIHGDAAAEEMAADLAKPGPRRLFPDDSGFERPTFTDAEYDEASDRAEARDTAHREWRAS